MTMYCTLKRSILVLTAIVALGAVIAAAGQKPEVQRLFESGAYDQAVAAARDGDPASTYIAALALIKLDRTEQAVAELTRLRGSENAAWRLIAESAEALLNNDAGRSVDLARRAIEADANNPFAQYQLGLAAGKANDWGTAVSGFTRSIELKPDFAYAHYYAALAYQRQRQLSKTAEHFDAFLRLAPDAPERSAVLAVLRTIK